MKPALVDVPVLILFFNRPQQLSQVFEQVKKARPSRLFLYQDGARNEHDLPGIKACREIVSQFPGSFYFDYFPLFSVGSGTQYSGCAEQTFSRYTGDYPHALGLDSGGGIRRVFYHGAAGGTDYPPLRLPHRGADGPGAVWHRGVAVHPGRTDSVV